MKKLGVLVGEDGNWTFFNDIYQELAQHFDTEVYRPRSYDVPLLYGRLNRWAFREGLKSMLERNDVCFFEWTSNLLVHASRLPKKSVVITRLHSFELYQWASEITWEFVDKIILVSEAMRQRFGEHFPDHLHKAQVVYNGVSLSEFTPNPPREFGFDLGMVCGITPVKRVYETVLMMYGLRELGYDGCLHLAGEPKGDPRYAAAVYRLVEKLGLEENVCFYGHVSQPASWLQQIDVFISNSYWEGHQVALVEAMAAGCYCLSHFWDGADEVLPEEQLFATESELLEKLIEHAEQTDATRRRRQEQMRDIACTKFDLDKTKVQIRRVVEEAAANGAR